MKGLRFSAVVILAGLVSVAICGENPPPLPSPLSLEQALSMIDDNDPQLAQKHAEVDQATAQFMRAESSRDLDVYLEGRARYIDPPSTAADQSHDDHRVGIVANKLLYDFGRSTARNQSAQYELDARKSLYLDAKARRQLEVVRYFFDVLLADLLFGHLNEAMATDFIRFDRLSQRKELGQASDIQVSEAEATYQQTRLRRYRSQTEQRQMRARLAEALNRPNQLPSVLQRPSLDILKRPLPEYDELVKTALESNHHVQALRARISAAEQRLALARVQDNPNLTGSAEAFNYSRESGSNDGLRASITLTVPLYSGRKDDAAIALAQAELLQVRSVLQQAESELRQTILNVWLQLDNLRVQREQVAALRKFRELNLDRSRALYEMEVRADLGDAMVLFSGVEHLSAEVDYKMFHTWLTLDMLIGRSVPAQITQPIP